MPAPAVPQPEIGATRLYYRDTDNISRPFAWMSEDRRLVVLDEGEVLNMVESDRMRNSSGVVMLTFSPEQTVRLIHWMMHAHRICGVESPFDLASMLRLAPDDQEYMPKRGLVG